MIGWKSLHIRWKLSNCKSSVRKFVVNGESALRFELNSEVNLFKVT